MLIKNAIPRSPRFDAWEAFTKGETVLSSFPSNITTSWKRCADANLDPQGMNISRVVSGEQLGPLISRNAPLLQVSRSSLEILERSLLNLSHAILLSDPEGNILYQSGTGRVLEDFEEAGLVPGGNCSEIVLGSTAPGVVLVEQKPTVMIQEEHYSQIYHWCCCAAVPIFDLDGHLRGCLDVTTTYDQAESVRLTLGLTMTTVRSIQSNLHVQQLLAKMDEAKEILNCTSNLTSKAVIVLDNKGRILHANQGTEELFKTPLVELIGTHYRQVMESDVIASCLSEKGTLRGSLKIRRHGGNERRTAVQSVPLRDKSGRMLGAVLVLEEEKRIWTRPPRDGSIATPYTFDDIQGKAPPIRRALQLARRFAPTDMPILLEGETGTGKEMFAQAIHNQSHRSHGPFVPVNCTALPRELVESELFGYERGAFTGARKEGKKGKFELADGGTLFLDEVNSMSSGLQAKLLRVLENGEIVRLGDHEYKHVNVRVIAASSALLEEHLGNDRFRADLFYRLNIVRIRLPSLRERKQDLEDLAVRFLRKSARKFDKNVSRFHPDVMDRFYAHPWRGNIRELENCVDFAVCLAEGELLLPEHLPDSLLSRQQPGRVEEIQKIESSLLTEALEAAHGNIGLAAKRLGISRSTLYRKRKQYGLFESAGKHHSP